MIDLFMVAVQDVKAMGWRIARLEQHRVSSGYSRAEWVHYCKDCG
jgi:hypothetical protein